MSNAANFSVLFLEKENEHRYKYQGHFLETKIQGNLYVQQLFRPLTCAAPASFTAWSSNYDGILCHKRRLNYA